MQAPTRKAVLASTRRPVSSTTSPFAMRAFQVVACTCGYRSLKKSMTVFHGPAGSHRQLGPTPSMKGSGAFKLTSLRSEPAGIMKGVVADHNYSARSRCRMSEQREVLLSDYKTREDPRSDNRRQSHLRN